jgi:hypothetical protein
LLEAARRSSARAVNAFMTATYWEIGRRIAEHRRLLVREYFTALPDEGLLSTELEKTRREIEAGGHLCDG